MAKLPEEVTMTLAQSMLAQEQKEVPDEEGLLYRLFSKLAKLFSQSDSADAKTDGSNMAETDNAESSNAGCSTNYGYPPAYGYPAYGVPAQVMVDLLNQCLNVLTELEVDDDELASKIQGLVKSIKEALGIPSAATVSSQATYDPLHEIRVAIKAQQGTQPVLPPIEAAERLENAWNSFKDVMLAETTGVGTVFDAVFALRAAVSIAVRSLKAVAVTEQSAAESEQAKAQEEQLEAANQQSEATQSEVMQVQEQVASEACVATNEVSGQGETSQNSSDSVMQASSGEQSENSHTKSDDFVATIVAGLSQRIDEIMLRLAALESIVRERKRVTQFAAASANAGSQEEDSGDNLLLRWQLAKTDAERRKILREAQKLLAAPRQL